MYVWDKLSKWDPLKLPIPVNLISTFPQPSKDEALENSAFVYEMTGGGLDCDLSARYQIGSRESPV